MTEGENRFYETFSLFISLSLDSSDLYWFSDSHVTPDLPQDEYYYSNHCSVNTPIIIDNGSWKCRAGWGSRDQPQFVFRSLMARMRGKRVLTENTLLFIDESVYIRERMILHLLVMILPMWSHFARQSRTNSIGTL